MTNAYAVPAIVAVTLVTVAIGSYGLRLARTTSDFLVASRAVSPRGTRPRSAGSTSRRRRFLGVAGLILKYGVDVLWYPVGFAAGYLALLLFVAAPLRRSGAFTLPDFCELRLGSPRLRKLATAFVIFIGWLYLVPQLQGAGLTLQHGHRRRRTRSGRCWWRWWSTGERGARRHAGDHLRAGLPVLAEAHRAGRTGDLPGAALAGRRPAGR